MSSFVLGPKKKGKKATWIEPTVCRESGTITYSVRQGTSDSDIKVARAGTKTGPATFRCLMSGTPITPEYIKEIGQEGRIGSVLIAIAVDGETGRRYLEPNDEHIRVAFSMDIASAAEECREAFLSGETPKRLTGGTCYPYGLDKWGKLFADRQLVALKTFLDLLPEVCKKIEQDALASEMSSDCKSLREGGCGAKAYAEAVCVYMALMISKCAENWSSICTWNASSQAIRGTFGRQALPMSWDYVEINPFCSRSANWSSIGDAMSSSIAGFVCKSPGTERHCDARTVDYPPSTVVSTDPPYYDNIAYADLSDYFFVWLRAAIRSTYPDLFGGLATPKDDELVATAYRHGGRDAAEEFFIRGMSQAIENFGSKCSSEFPTTIYYAFKQSKSDKEGTSSVGWAAFLQAVIQSGYMIVGTWPVRTERRGRMNSNRTNALANSIVLVCRQRKAGTGNITRKKFIGLLKQELPLTVARLRNSNVAPADMPQSAIGPGMEIFSRHEKVSESNDSPMQVQEALRIINQELDVCHSNFVGEFDDETRFAVTWYEQFGYDSVDFGTAQVLAQVRGLSVDDVEQAGIIESKDGKVRILRREELPQDWNVSKDGRITIWKGLQYVTRGVEQGERAAALLLGRMGKDRVGSVRDLAYHMHNLAGNRRKEPQEATPYNALIGVWPNLINRLSIIGYEDEQQPDLYREKEHG